MVGASGLIGWLNDCLDSYMNEFIFFECIDIILVGWFKDLID